MHTADGGCACCGKGYGRRVTSIHTATVAAGQPAPAPPAGGQVMAHKWFAHGNNDVIHVFTLWDGQSWRRPYAPFCGKACALAYARAEAAKREKSNV